MTTWIEDIADWMKPWEETLAPKTPLEQRMVKFIARQDWLLHRFLLEMFSTEDQSKARECSNIKRNLSDSMDCMLQAFTIIQQRRTDAGHPPPPAKAKAKVVKIPNRSPAGLGRYQRFKPQTQTVPAVEPFSASRSDSKDERGSGPRLEVKLAA